jgi:cell division protein FtsB
LSLRYDVWPWYRRDSCCTLLRRVPKDETKTTPKRRAPQPKRPGRARQIARVLLLLVAAVVMVNAVVGDRGLLALLRARQQYDDLVSSISRQRAENDRLREEARRLREDPDAIEEIARRELGLIRRGEKVFIVKDLKPQTTP